MVACTNCGANSIEHDSAMGNSFCTNCGLVVEENAIVSEVTFGETSSGQAVLQGSFVADGRRGVASMGPGGRRQVSMLSKEQSIANGRRAILAMGTALRLSERYTDTAQRYFNLAIANNFTAGRKTAQVAAACLYAACRAEKTSHMLIDFSDVMQINVFVLGSIFLKMIKELHISLPLVDPSLYISRFAALLEFGEHTQQVAGDAMRLVQRMDRDWLHTGRKPAGICGACLMIAARMNNFQRTPQEILQVVKIAEVTLRKRLEEFSETPTGKLNVRDFRTVWLESAADPPAFDRLLKRKKLEGTGDDDDKDDNTDGENGDDIDELESRLKRNKKIKLVDGVVVEEEEEETNGDSNATTSDVVPSTDSDETNGTANDETPNNAEYLAEIPPTQNLPLESHAESVKNSTTVTEPGFEPVTQAPPSFLDLTTISEVVGPNGFLNAVGEDDTAASTSQLDEDAALEKEMEGYLASDKLKMISQNMEANPVSEAASFSDLEDDAEIENVMLNQEEVGMKQRIWEDNNRDWIIAQEEKRRLAIERGEDPNKPKRKGGPGRKNANTANSNPATSAADAAKQLLNQKKLSKKINYAALDALFEDDPQGAAATAVARRSVRATASMGSALAGEIEETEETITTTPRRVAAGNDTFQSPSRLLGSGSALTRSLRAAGMGSSGGLGRALSRSSSRFGATRSPSVVPATKPRASGPESSRNATAAATEEDGDEHEDEEEDVDDWKRQVKKVGQAGRDMDDDEDDAGHDDEEQWWDGHDEV